MKLPSLLILACVLAAGIGAGGGWYLSSDLNRGAGRSDPQQPMPVYGQAPAYTLTDQLGQPVRSTSFRGKVQIVTFLFPYCTEYCPLIAKQLVKTEKALRETGLASRVQLVSFNVDPANTGPATLRAFMQEYGWNPADTHWQYLTGRPRVIRRVVTGGYHVDYERVSEAKEEKETIALKNEGLYKPGPHVDNPLARRADPDYDVVHNDDMLLVDPDGRVRAVIAAPDKLPAARVVHLVRRLLRD